MSDDGTRMRRNAAEQLWEATVDFGIVDGKRKRITRKSKTKDGLRRKLRELETARDEGRRVLSRTYTTGAFLRHWIENVAPNRGLKQKTVEDYAGLVRNYLLPALDKVPLSLLEVADVDMMLADMRRRGLSAKTASLARGCLVNALKSAQLDELVYRNVASLSRSHPVQPKIDDALDLEEMRTVLAAAAGDRLGALAVLVLGTGMRQGECLDLDWSALDLDRGKLNVRAAKTPAGVREVPLPGFVVEALRKWRQIQRLERIAAANWVESGRVFTRPSGRPLSHPVAYNWWIALLKTAGVPRRRFHASRHSAATLMLNNGVELEVVSAILGHTNIAITARVYARVGEPLKRDAAARMDALLG